MSLQTSSKETLNKINKIISNLEQIRNRLSVFGFIIVISIITYNLVDYYFDIIIIYKILLDKVGTQSGLWSTITIIFLIGILLVIFKFKQQFWYGIFETVFALVTCYLTIKSITINSEMLTILIAIGSTLYLIVRGLTNVIDGLEKSFWIKNDFSELGNNIDAISRKSLFNLLKDRAFIVDVLTVMLNFFTEVLGLRIR